MPIMLNKPQIARQPAPCLFRRGGNRVIKIQFLLLFLLFCIASCSPGPEKPEILFLITLDTTRADSIQYNQQFNSATPNLAGLAAAGFYGRNAYSLIPITLPAHAAMFFSQPPHQLKIYNNSQPREITSPSLAQILKGNGFLTGAVISLGVMKAEFGMAKGFDEYIENFRPFLWIRSGAEVTEDAIALIKKTEERKKAGQKSFYWIHYSDPHEPYFPKASDGHFSINLQNRNIFRCLSIEQPAVNLEFELAPGINQLDMEAVLPEILADYPEFSFHFLQFQNFSLQPVEPSETPLKIDFPASWKSRVERNSTHYYSTELKSTLNIKNLSLNPVKVRLEFVYSLYADEDARKLFYADEIKYMDAQIGVLLDFLKKRGLAQKAAYVVVGDHGEGLGEYRGHFGHIHYLNRVYTQVPLIVSGVGVKKRSVKEEVITILDVAPTILELAGIKTPRTMLGKSLLSEQNRPHTVLLETYSPEAYFDSFSLLRYPWQVIFNPGFSSGVLQFINLEEDQFGVIDLNPDNDPGRFFESDETKEIRRELIQEVLKISRIITATKGKAGKPSQRHQEILRSLGYL